MTRRALGSARLYEWNPGHDRVWRAERVGEVYCAPACGRKCTWEEYCGAVKSAKLLARKLGPGWTPFVWENLGWKYSARSACGMLKVHVDPGMLHWLSRKPMYHAFFGPEEIGGRWAAHGSSPLYAVRNVITLARDEIREIQEFLTRVRPSIRVAKGRSTR